MLACALSLWALPALGGGGAARAWLAPAEGAEGADASARGGAPPALATPLVAVVVLGLLAWTECWKPARAALLPGLYVPPHKARAQRGESRDKRD